MFWTAKISRFSDTAISKKRMSWPHEKQALNFLSAGTTSGNELIRAELFKTKKEVFSRTPLLVLNKY